MPDVSPLLSPGKLLTPSFFSSIHFFFSAGEQAAAPGGEGAFPGLPQRGDSDRGGRSVLQRREELL